MKDNVRIVAAIDFDESARVTLATAAKLAGREGRITVVHVAARGREIRKDADGAAKAMAEHERQLRELLVRELGDASNPIWGKMDAQIGVGDAAEQVVQLAIDLEADFIVVGRHARRGLERLTLGSVSAEVSSSAPCTVVIAREADYEDREKTVEIEAAPAQGEPASIVPSAPLRPRRKRFSFYDANIVPTGIPRGAVR